MSKNINWLLKSCIFMLGLSLLFFLCSCSNNMDTITYNENFEENTIWISFEQGTIEFEENISESLKQELLDMSKKTQSTICIIENQIFVDDSCIIQIEKSGIYFDFDAYKELKESKQKLFFEFFVVWGLTYFGSIGNIDLFNSLTHSLLDLDQSVANVLLPVIFNSSKNGTTYPGPYTLDFLIVGYLSINIGVLCIIYIFSYIISRTIIRKRIKKGKELFGIEEKLKHTLKISFLIYIISNILFIPFLSGSLTVVTILFIICWIVSYISFMHIVISYNELKYLVVISDNSCKELERFIIGMRNKLFVYWISLVILYILIFLGVI